jgi:NADH-quinone oxidoreductase subunit A
MEDLLKNPYLQYAAILAFTLFGVAFVFLNVSVVARMLRAQVPDPAKETTYECGEPTIGSSWVQFDIRFYNVALLFIIFDVEVAFLFPWAASFGPLKAGRLPAIWEVLAFIVVLGLGYVFAWKKGDLDWIKSTAAHDVAIRGRMKRLDDARKAA